MQMKKVLGILLAFCFVMSVTAAAASAEPFDHDKKDKKFGDDHKKFGDDHKKFNDDHKKVKHFHPGHWDKHKVAHKKFISHKVVTVYVVEKYFVPGFWGYD